MVTMKRCMVPTILLMLGLQAAQLVAGDDVGAILLPSQAQDEAAMAAAKKRPWKCCDEPFCTRSFPPICTCMDQDQYTGDPGPICRPWKCCDKPAPSKSNLPTCRCGDEVDKCSDVQDLPAVKVPPFPPRLHRQLL
ncbi:hypothetical protein ZWY2020_025285 [Hordeum vulgare]|nr:hypothetical protein ZWY2020_025285 [Hordeum vulgare]